MAGHTSAQPVDIPATWGGDFRYRPRLTGDWGGWRDEVLGKKGVVLNVHLLQTLQGVASGGRNEVATDRGLAEYTLNVDTQKLGLWPGGFLRVQGMSSFGQNINHASGALLSPNFASLLPEPGGDATGLMNLTFMQFLNKHVGVFLGKVSGLGADYNAFAHNYHTDFLNSALNLNLALALFPSRRMAGASSSCPGTGPSSRWPPSIRVGRPRTMTSAMPSRTACSSLPRAGSPSSPLAWSATSSWEGGGATKSGLLVQDPANIGRTVLTNQFPRLVDPGPVLARFLERFFPALLVPTQPLNREDDTWTIYGRGARPHSNVSQQRTRA